MNRNTQIVINDDLLRKIVYCIEKAIGDDLQQYLRENHRETNNAIILLRGDNINTNLRTHVVKDDIDLVPFQRYGWSGRMVIDRKEHITYSIMTEGTLSGVPKKKNRENPHYLQSVLYVENKDCIAKERQMTLEDFGITIFDTDVLEQDFEKISQGMINVEEDYKHYISKNKTERACVKDSIKLAEEKGFKPLESFDTLKSGDKVYVTNRGKNIALFIIGKKPLTEGMRILGAHIDSPRMDLKQNPLYESEGFTLADTHYYLSLIHI